VVHQLINHHFARHGLTDIACQQRGAAVHHMGRKGLEHQARFFGHGHLCEQIGHPRLDRQAGIFIGI